MHVPLKAATLATGGSMLFVLGCAGSTVATTPSMPTPTTAPAPTVTPTTSGPHIVAGATLGGTQDAFQATYGAPDPTNPSVPSFTFTTHDGISAQIHLDDLGPGIDGQHRLEIFRLSSPDWTQAQALAATSLFFPPDAHHVQDVPTPDVGPLHVYQSADLALTFPASAFTDSSTGQPVPPGTFLVACEQPNNGPCTVAIGR